MKNSLKSLFSDKRGLALVEFALFLPIILLMFFGVVEFTRYVIITQKAERSAYVLSNITSQFTPIKFTAVATEASTTTLDNQVFAQFARTMDVYNTASDRIAIISSITKTKAGNSNDTININWQRSGGGSLNSTQAVSLLNGVNASAINSTSSANGSTAGTSPTFPAYDGQLMHGALSDMNVGENMIITEAFYSYQPFLGSMLNGLGSSAMPASIMKSVVFTRPRNGDLSTLVRPDAPDSPTSTTESSDSCIDVTLTPSYLSCFAKNILVNGNCQVQTDCDTCTGKHVCKSCTTASDGKTTCSVTSSNYTGCTKTQTFRNCRSGSGTTTTPPPRSSPPPS